MRDVPAGTYRVQAFLNRYETFGLADGRVLKLAPDRGEGQQWASKPGNLYSTPRTIRWDPAKPASIALSLDNEIPALPDPALKETKYVKYVKIRSERLSKFWGRPMHLGAVVLLPHGFDEHPQARYPLVVFHGHFPYTASGFREIRRVLRPGATALVFDLPETWGHVETGSAGIGAASEAFDRPERSRMRGLGPWTLVWRVRLRRPVDG
jgi:hypothetical protein